MDLRFDSEGTPWGVGFLSVREMTDAATSLQLPISFTFDTKEFILDPLPDNTFRILLYDNHYYLRYKAYTRNCIFDSGGLQHCVDALPLSDLEKRVLRSFVINETPYQRPESTICGHLCLFVVLMSRRNRVALTDVFSVLENVVANDFLMTQFAVLKQIGEEFNQSDPRYWRVRMMSNWLSL